MEYTPLRKRNLYIPFQEKPFSLSRSKVELYLECPHCFYLDRRRGLSRPPIHPYNLNLTVDHLLKREFDLYRAKKEAHPLMKAFDKELQCFDHPELSAWRENFQGIKYIHHDTNFILTGAVDDLWIKDGKIIVVDYKATSSEYKLTYKGPGYDRYKRQLDFYTYLLAKLRHPISEKALFFVCNATKSRPSFEGHLDFDMTIIEHKVDMTWIEDVIFEIFDTLQSPEPPASSDTCNYCNYCATKGSL